MKNQPLLRVFFYATLICFCLIQKVNAQNITDAFVSIADSTGQSNYFTVVLSDTTNISEIEVRLGDDLGASQIMLHSFSFDSQANNPYSYYRSGYVIKLGIGSITQNASYNGEVRLKYQNSTWSNPFQFISN